MTDPASSGAAGAAAFKAVGGASAVAAGGAGLAAVVVMLMTPPRSPREWAVGLISTVVASIGGGAAAPRHAQGRMVRLGGIAALLMIAGAPYLILPERHVMGAGVVAAAICAGGLPLPSLGVTTVGAVLAVLVFSVALLVASTTNAVIAAMLMGIAVLMLLDATHFQQQFSRSLITPGVVRAHLGQLGAAVLVSVLAIGVLAVVSEAFWLGLDAALRPAIAAAGGILVVLAILRATTR